MSFLSTPPLISDPALATLVAQLAQAPRIESARIGEGGSLSDTHALFTRITQAATPQQLVALLRHQSAVVRGYLAKHVIAALPSELDAVYPLLADFTEVEEMSGCIISRTTVSQVTLQALRAQVQRPAVQELLLRAVQDAPLGELRAEALQYVAKLRPGEATALAKVLLREPSPHLLAGAIRTLGMTAAADSAEALCALAGAAESEVRAAVAAALGSLSHLCIEPTLRKLTADSETYVRLLAAASYVRTPERDLAIVRRILRDPTPRVHTYAAQALAERAGTQDLVLLREYLIAEPSSSEVLSALRKSRQDEVTAFMREVLTSPMGTEVLVRAQALSYLRDAADPESLPLFLTALASSYIGERTAAAEGIAALGARSAAPALRALLADANPHGRLAAARALVKLQSSESRAALKRAAADDSSWAKKEMTELANQLLKATAD